jgi:hypothetical protein
MKTNLFTFFFFVIDYAREALARVVILITMQDWNTLHNPNVAAVLDCGDVNFFPKPFSRVLHEDHDSSIDWTSAAVNSFPAARENRGFSWFDGRIQPSLVNDCKYINASNNFVGRYFVPNQVSESLVFW